MEPGKRTRLIGLVWKLIFPLTIISFFAFDKWWYVYIYDGPDKFMYGFPLAYACDALHTSMARHYFILELAIDLLIYFSFWSVAIFLINRFWVRIQVPKYLAIFNLSIAGIILAGMLFWASLPGHTFELKRPFEVEVKETGLIFMGGKQNLPEYLSPTYDTD